mgnify:FL=1
MKQWTALSLLMGALFTILLFTSDTLADETVTPTGEYVNLRDGPGLTYSVVGTLDAKKEATVLSTDGEWYEVKVGQQKGWVASWLVTAKSSEADVDAKADVIVATTDGLNVRSGPSIQSTVIGKMNAGVEAKRTIERDGWSYVTIDGMDGWVSNDYVQVIAANETDEPKQPDEEETTPLPTDDTFFVEVDQLNVRAEASLSSEKVGTVKRDESYLVLDRQDNWVQLALPNESKGWLYAFYGSFASDAPKQADDALVITTVADGTNVRTEPTTDAPIAKRLSAGEQFTVQREIDDWYAISVGGETAYVASWVVAKPSNDHVPSADKKASIPGTLNGISIVIDPGHGGRDRGTTGARGTKEKDLTLRTSHMLADKLRAAGASVHMTRESDVYVPLRTRAAMKDELGADAFISIHYDANTDSSIHGITSYYYHDNQQALTQTLNHSMMEAVSNNNRGAQFGDFLVIRENSADSVLLELGFLTNVAEEQLLMTTAFQEDITRGIYNGLLRYFND